MVSPDAKFKGSNISAPINKCEAHQAVGDAKCKVEFAALLSVTNGSNQGISLKILSAWILI